MSGTSTTASDAACMQHDRRQPSAYSSSEIWDVCGPVSSPETSFTRHLPHEPLPEHGASMATLALRAASSTLSSGETEITTGFSSFSNWKVSSNMIGDSPKFYIPPGREGSDYAGRGKWKS